MKIVGVKAWAIACGIASVVLGGIVTPIAFAPSRPKPPEPCFNYTAQDYGVGSVRCPHPRQTMKVTPRTNTDKFLVECRCPETRGSDD